MNKDSSPDIQRILEAGNSAPSGENCQPWHFVVSGTSIEVHLLPERDQSAYSWGQRTSYLANGAVIENIVIAASVEQYRVEVTYFPDQKNAWHIATLRLHKDLSTHPDVLAPFIHARVSNRKPYSKKPLKDEEQEALTTAVREAHFGSLVLAMERETLHHLGRVGSTNEEVMLANQSLHQFFFSHVNWTREEDEKKKIGFYIKTLELPPPVEILFRIFRNWSIMSLLSLIGFNRIVASQNAKLNASAAAIGALTIRTTEPLDFVKIGRTVERLWLTATSLGLAFQPLTGLFYFNLKIMHGEGDIFSPYQRKLITNACDKASRLLGAEGTQIAFMFRIGRGADPSARAIRFPLKDVVTAVS